GINSAMGLLTTDLKYDAVQTAFLMSTAMDYERLNRGFAEMEAKLLAQFRDDGLEPEDVHLERFADVRYAGQGYELRVSMPRGEIGPGNIAAALDEFHGMHEKEYGHSFRASPVEFVNIRVTGTGPIARLGAPPPRRGG